ncbi:phage adaptor protein [Mycoplana ramosa]|uniref:Uncharacterized protein n=1 Tax=Mycoplana ramosa TaxID=40837 RepID=A0ABW3YT13_MYCRA
MTYDELLETIESYTIRDDAPITSFIRRAETYLRTITKHYLAEKTVLLNVTNGKAELPSDFREIRTITGTRTYKPIAPSHAQIESDEVGYYREGNTLVFVGEVDSQVGFLYHAAFPDLTEDQSNWLFERFPNVYVSAILKEFHRWQTNPEGVSIEDAALKEALAIVAEDDRRGRQTGTIYFGASTWQ